MPGRRENESDGPGVVQDAHHALARRRNAPRDFAEPPKTIVGLVPKVSLDGESGVAEAARPSLPSDTAVVRGQETGGIVASELALRGPDAHAAVQPTRLPVLQGRAGPVLENVLSGVKEI